MIFFILIYLCIVIFTVAQSASTKLFSKVNDDSVAFNKIKSVTAFALFALMSVGGFQFHPGTVFFGCLFGILMCLSMQAGYLALASGPMSLTSMIVSFSVVIPVVYGIGFCNEGLTLFKMLGLFFFVVAIVFTNIKKPSSQNSQKGGIKWAFYVLATFCANGFNSIIQKVHQAKYNSQYCVEFMFWAMLVCFVVFMVVGFKRLPVKKLVATKGKIFGITGGITNALVGYLTIKLAGYENASVLFPAISAGTILGTLAVGIGVFKEKPRFNHIVAFVSGIVAVVFLKL